MTLDHAWAVIAHASCAVLATSLAGGLAYWFPRAVWLSAHFQRLHGEHRMNAYRGARTAGWFGFLVIVLAIWWGNW